MPNVFKCSWGSDLVKQICRFKFRISSCVNKTHGLQCGEKNLYISLKYYVFKSEIGGIKKFSCLSIGVDFENWSTALRGPWIFSRQAIWLLLLRMAVSRVLSKLSQQWQTCKVMQKQVLFYFMGRMEHTCLRKKFSTIPRRVKKEFIFSILGYFTFEEFSISHGSASILTL